MRTLLIVLVSIAIGWELHGSAARAWSDNDLTRAFNNIDASLGRIATALEKCSQK